MGACGFGEGEGGCEGGTGDVRDRRGEGSYRRVCREVMFNG